MISLMMITYNRLELTKNTLWNIFETIHSNINLIIVDNGSTDGTVEVLENIKNNIGKTNINLIVKYNKTNKGIAIGRNQGLKLAVDLKSDWLCTIDNDVELPDGWLEECINILKLNPQYAAIGVNFEATSFPIVELNGCRFQNKPQGNLGTACMVFPGKVQKMLGYFNTGYGTKYSCEDSDFGMRIRSLGLKLGYIERNGIHIGEGENDKGEYRKFKDAEHKKAVPLFYNNARLYMTRKKGIYIPYKD